MNDQTDQQLLRDYAERNSEAAFVALVHRYVDLVYSAAFRMVNDDHAAKDVTQNVFVALAQNARQLTDRPVLAGWLHNTARNLAVKTVRTEVRRRAREQEAALMNELLSAHPDASWEHIAPLLDDALGELSEPDRDAVLLRHFKNYDLRTVGATLGISDDAAQKRVSRAVERLREFFAKRGVTVGAGGLAVVISANAVQAAPVGLALTISTAVALTGTTLATTATVAATKAIAMTALQKTIVTATIVVLAGAGIYEARQAAQLRGQVQELWQQQMPLAEQVKSMESEREQSARQLATLREDIERLSRNTAELLRLRGEVTKLRADSPSGQTMVDQSTDSSAVLAKSWLDRVNKLKQSMQQMPEKQIPELQFLTAQDWFDAAREADVESDDGVRKAFSKLRSSAKGKFAGMLSGALSSYAKANDGRLPTDTHQLISYFEDPVDNALLQRYEMLQTGTFDDARGKWLMTEIAPVDNQYDTRYYISTSGTQGSDVDAYSPENYMARKYPSLGK